MTPWIQNYDPLGNPWLSTTLAALPVVVLLAAIALVHIRIHVAAVLGLGVALALAVGIYHMPVVAAAASAGYGAIFGLFPIGWIILNVIFLYELTVRRGLFAVLRDSLAGIAPDPRVQVILIAFCFGAFIEGVAGFGTPVAITGAILIQLGFKPLPASGLALIANTAPVAFGSLGIPITTLEQVAGLDALQVSKMVGRQLPLFSLIIPFWVVGAMGGWRAMRGIWPAALVAGVGFAVPQFVVSNFHGPWLVDTISGSCSILALVVLLRVWQPRDGWTPSTESWTPPAGAEAAGSRPALTRRAIWQAWRPWVILCAFILLWGTPLVKQLLRGEVSLGNAAGRLGIPLPEMVARWRVPAEIAAPGWSMPGLHDVVQRVPPVAPAGAPREKAVVKLDWTAATGTGILGAALVAGCLMRFPVRELFRTYLHTVWRIRYSLATIAAMLALGNVTKFSGADATLGLALAGTGVMYPFFGTLLGWLGVALTGSDTASNVLFGSLQRITAEQLGISPILMGAANSSGGVMGKMVDAQSIVVASTATNYYGQEGRILRFVFWHSLVLAVLVALWVLLQAYVPPFSSMVVR